MRRSATSCSATAGYEAMRYFEFIWWFYLVCVIQARETVYDAARLSRGLIESPLAIGTMATIYPQDHPTLPGEPFALQEYYALCHSNGSLTLILMPISRHSQNILRSPSHAASMTVWSTPPAASKARVSLMGNVTMLDSALVARSSVQACYLKRHPDARWWLPEDPDAPHTSFWARFDPHSVYFVGGFGDEHYIGSIPIELYQNSTGSLSHIEELVQQPAQALGS